VSGLPDEPHSGKPRELLERMDAERRAMPFLVYRDAAGQQQLVHLDAAPARISIGRHPDSDVPVAWDGEASRLHAELERIAGEWTVVDDGRSRNGTFLNGERVLGRRLLADRDVIRVGRTLLLFRHPAPTPTSATTMPAGRGVPELSPAQRRVLVALCRPLAHSTSFASPASNRQIADELVISGDTVKTHLRALFEAFGIGPVPQNEKRAALAREAIERGIVTSHDLEREVSPGRFP
jgi:hypothetical protein